MKPMVVSVLALGCANLVGLSALAVPGETPQRTPPVQLAESSDGAGLPGLPGGRGGKSGLDLARESAASRTDRRLTDYCIGLLRSGPPASAGGDLGADDCAAYFSRLESGAPAAGPGFGRGGDRPDGAGIAGGVGGQGGRAGSGPGGGAGGAGGLGLGGGEGGRGGAGGGGY